MRIRVFMSGGVLRSPHPTPTTAMPAPSHLGVPQGRRASGRPWLRLLPPSAQAQSRPGDCFLVGNSGLLIDAVSEEKKQKPLDLQGVRIFFGFWHFYTSVGWSVCFFVHTLQPQPPFIATTTTTTCTLAVVHHLRNRLYSDR